MSKFIELTDYESNSHTYVMADKIQVRTTLTEYIVHSNDYDFEQKKDSYDNSTWFTGVNLFNGAILHVKETPAEIMAKIQGVRNT